MELLSPKTIRAERGKDREAARKRNEKLSSEEKRLVERVNNLKIIEKEERKKTADAIAANDASLAVKQTVLAKEVGALEARKAEAMKPVDEKLLEAKQLIADNKLQLEAIEISRAELETTKQKILELDSALKNKETEIDRRNETLDRREKAISAGEGGYIVTHDARLAEMLRRASNFGIDHYRGDRVSTGWGTNCKMSEYNAAVALASLDAWDREPWLRLYDWYARYLPESVTQQARPRGVYPIVSVKLPCRVEPVARELAAQGIETRRWYCPPMHTHPAMAGNWRRLPVTEDLAEHLLGLPYHPFLTEDDVERICVELTHAIERSSR